MEANQEEVSYGTGNMERDWSVLVFCLLYMLLLDSCMSVFMF